jgi:hypothetical protein
MIFGTKEAFAIEAMSESELKPPSAVWGRMQVWCQGASIGDFSNEYCSLYVSYLSFKALSTRFHQLWKTEFDGLSDEALWNHLDELLYGYHGDIELEDDRSIEECQRDWDEYGVFNFLTNWGEQFDQGGKSFIVCTPAQQVRILNRSLPPSCGLALEAPVFQVSGAINGFLRWFEEEASRLGNPVT